MSDGRESAKNARSAASRKSERIERTGSTPITWLSGSRSGLTLKVLRRLNCCSRKRLRGLAEATRIDLAKAAVTISPEREDGASGGLQLRPFFPIRLLEDRPSLKRNVELSPTGHNWTAWARTVLPHCGHGNENDSGIPRGRAPKQ